MRPPPFLLVAALCAGSHLPAAAQEDARDDQPPGLSEADPDAVEAATALGMTPGQVLRRVRLPLAVPTIMAGVRTAGVITVGTATIGAFIGAGGLGQPIIAGVQLVNIHQILSGAIPAALLALVTDAALGGLGRLLRPRGVGP